MARIITIEEATEIAKSLRDDGKTLALANGAFDLLHVGHVRYLQAASEAADRLLVAVNSDSSVRAYKGEDRPIIPEDERAEIVAALTGVDFVLIFSEPNVEAVIKAVRPDFQCKGTDYTEDSVPEGDLVRSLGGQVLIVGDPKDHNSTDIINQLDGAKR
jgi:rfaE bifunctional protein nucleotidyltransferase chain/domain